MTGACRGGFPDDRSHFHLPPAVGLSSDAGPKHFSRPDFMPTARSARFLSTGKSGTDLASVARDAGVLLSLAFPPKQFATPSPAARRKSPRRFWVRLSIPSPLIHFREASDGC